MSKLNIRKIIAELKVYLNRATSYLTIINTGMILLPFIATLNLLGLNINVKIGYPILFVVALLVALLIGRIDIKSGIFSSEMNRIYTQNPVMIEMLERMKRIEDKLEIKKK